MKRLPLLFVLLLVVAVAGSAGGWYLFSNQTPEIDLEVVRIGVDVPYPPYEYRDANGELTGFEIELGNATCDYLGIECEWVVVPWENIIPGLLDGQYDAIMSSMTINDERAERVDFGKAYYSTPSVLFVRKQDNIASASVSDLQGLSVGTIANTIQAEYLRDEYGDNIRLLTYETNEDVNDAMRSGELDVVFHDYPHWEREFMVDGGYEIIGQPRQLGEGVGMAFRPEDDNLRRLFNQGLDTMKSNGTYTMIRKRFLFFEIMVD